MFAEESIWRGILCFGHIYLKCGRDHKHQIFINAIMFINTKLRIKNLVRRPNHHGTNICGLLEDSVLVPNTLFIQNVFLLLGLF